MAGDKASIEFTIDGQSAITTLDKIVEKLKSVRVESDRATSGDNRWMERQATSMERQIANNIGKIENSEYARLAANAKMRGVETIPEYMKQYASYLDATNAKWEQQEALLKSSERDLNNLLNLTAKIRAAQEGTGAVGEAALRQEYRSNGTFANMASAQAEMEKFGITTARAASEGANALRSLEMEILNLEAKTSSMSRGDYLRRYLSLKGVEITPQIEAAIAKIDQLIAKERQASVQTAQVDKAFQKYGITTGQLNAAMRSLPAQMTDIVVSLQSGQMPLTVLLQQGGQIKDMFGSVKAALVETGKYLMSNAHWFALAGAVATVGVAFYNVAQEAQNLNRAVILTNASAGKTVTELDYMASSLGEVTGKFGDARSAVEALAASGKLFGKNFEDAAKITVDMATLTGKKTEELAGMFDAVAKDPVEGFYKLNEVMRFLDEQTMAHIITLQKQGNTQEAIRVGMEALGQTSASKTAEMAEQASVVAKAWEDVRSAILWAWEALKDIMRENLAAQAAARREAIRSAKEGAWYMSDDTSWIADEEKKLDELEKRIKQQNEGAGAEQRRRNARVNSLYKGYKDSQKKHSSKNSGGGKGRSSGESLITGINEKIAQNKLEAASIDAVTEADKLRIKIEQDGIVGKAKYSDAEKRKALSLLDELEKTERLAGAAKMMREEDQKRDKQIREIQRTTETNIATMAMSSRQADIYSFSQKTMAEAEDKVAEAKRKGILTAELEKDIYDNATKTVEAYTQAKRDEAAANEDWRAGAMKALSDYAEQSTNVYDGVKTAVANGLKAMEDSLVEFATTGKLTFKDFADSVIKEILRIYAKMVVTGLVNMFVGSFASAAAGSGSLDASLSDFSYRGSGVSFRASGGPVSAGKRYIIGEKGPELFIPNASGTVIPNNQLTGGSTGQISVQIDHHNEGTQQQVTDSSADFDGKNLIIKIVTQDIQNDGMISRTMSKNFGIRRAAGAM